MRIDDLTYFLAVADTGLMHRAADQVGISQPALTKAIRRLEDTLGVALFVRTAKGMRLTEFGETFRTSALKLDREHRNALQLIDESKAGQQAKVRVGVTPANESYVNDTFLRMLKHRPLMRLEIRVQLSDSLFGMLHNGDVDFVLGPVPHRPSEEFDVEILKEESFYVISSSNHRLHADGKPVSIKDLADEHWVLPGKTVFVRQQLEAMHQRAGLGPLNVQVMSDYTSPVGPYELVGRSDLLGVCVPSNRHLAEYHGARVLNLKGVMRYRTLGIFTLKEVRLSPLTSSFIENLRSVVADSRRHNAKEGKPVD